MSVLSILLLCGAEKPESGILHLVNDTIDLGDVPQDSVASAPLPVTNTGTAPLVIVKVTNGGCGCTTPSYPKQPIAPGKSGEIVIHFDPSGRRGEFNREVKVKTNASGKRIGLRFKGVIIPK